MPRQPTITEIRLDNIVACLTPVVALLNELNDACGPSFVQAISNTTLSLITGVQKVKRNKDECVQFMENIHKLLYAIINMHLKSETAGSLPPITLDHLGKFTETLHKIHMFVEMQQDGNKFKHLFRQNEMSTIRKSCHKGLQGALQVFKLDTTISNNIAEMSKTAETMHKELLEMVSELSDGSISDRSSSFTTQNDIYTGLQSSKSFSMLPSMPKIFHGRDSDLQDIVKVLHAELPRIAILGAGGMGKTCLARAALHHPEIATKYEHRFFIACDSANNSLEIAALLGAHLGLNPGKDLTKPVLKSLSSRPPSLLILDNLETPWEPKESRSGVEEFLSLLADIEHLALIITLRGVERPAKVRWTRPFLQPLKPLTDNAAWQTFVDIAEDCHTAEDINLVLHLTDNMPLAVDLISHLVADEGCSNVLGRWETEKTSLLSTGLDKRSNLDASIALSLSSPRMNSLPGAKGLLSLLSILPDGLSDLELLQSKLSIQDILSCKATLIRTSLAYIDDKKRLRCLVPIREHILRLHPPSSHLIGPLLHYFHLLLDLYQAYAGQMEMTSKMNQITSNLGNLKQILRQGLHSPLSDLSEVIQCTISLNSFCRVTGHNWLDLMDIIPEFFPQPCNHRLEVQFIIETFNSRKHHPVPTPELLVTRAISHFHNFNDSCLQATFYHAAGSYYYFSKNDSSMAMPLYEKALTSARLSGNPFQQSEILNTIAVTKQMIGDNFSCWTNACEAQRLAQVAASCHEETRALRAKAHCYTSKGDYQQSITLLSRGRELLRLCGLGGGTLDSRIMFSEAEVNRYKSEYAQARRITTEILQNTSAEQNPYTYAGALVNIAELDVMIGASNHAVHRNLNKARVIFEKMGQPNAIIACETTLADLHLREGHTVAARTLFQKCFNSSWGKVEEEVMNCLERLGDVSRWRVTDFDWSSHWTVVYLAYAKIVQKKLDLYKALQFLGDVYLQDGDEETAHSLFIVALAGFTYMDVHHSRANCMVRLGDIAHHRGQLDEAVEFWQNARPLFELSLQTKDVVQIDARLGGTDHHQKTLAQLAILTVPIGFFETLSVVDDTHHLETEEEEEYIKEHMSPVTI
ncbi:hypothetical protein FB451DRAFT_1379364 [Mycena latifolia]|nr:hypothetical protein FB451DRAFT_1379364 [Mycena latifolia]